MISAKCDKGRESITIEGLGNTSYGVSIGTAYALHAFLGKALDDWERTRKPIIRDAIDHVEGRIKGIDILMKTPADQRTESAQDDKIKETKFELSLVLDILKGEKS